MKSDDFNLGDELTLRAHPEIAQSGHQVFWCPDDNNTYVVVRVQEWEGEVCATYMGESDAQRDLNAVARKLWSVDQTLHTAIYAADLAMKEIEELRRKLRDKHIETNRLKNQLIQEKRHHESTN